MHSSCVSFSNEASPLCCCQRKMSGDIDFARWVAHSNAGFNVSRQNFPGKSCIVTRYYILYTHIFIKTVGNGSISKINTSKLYNEQTMSSVSPTKSLPHTDSMPSPAPASLWSQLLHKMHPRTCLSAVNSDLPLDVEFPLIYTDLQPSASLKMQTKALQKLYELTSQKNQLYRYVMLLSLNLSDLRPIFRAC
jgi:hypothetical protein